MSGSDGALFVYLDTSFLSQFANVEIGKPRVPHVEKWRALLARLRQEVQRGTLICPASQFQIEEALLSPKLMPQFTRIQSELSKGYFFKYWEDILGHQTANRVLMYLQRPQHVNLGWNALTKQTPDIVPPQVARNAKEAVMRFAEGLSKEEVPKRSFTEQYEAEKIGLVQELFLQPLRQLQGIDTYYKSPEPIKDLLPARDLLHTGFLGMLISEANIAGNELREVLAFFDSNLVDQVPFIDIYCSICASLRIGEQTRKPKSGDLFDVVTLACTIPYCDIVTTDTNMKTHLVDRLQLDIKYGTRIFAATAKDLDAFLEKLPPITQ